MFKNRFQWLQMLGMALLLLVAGCEEGTSLPPASSGEGSASGPLRVVSLSPALTQMMMDMGRTSVVVGVDDSHAMVFKDLSLPTVGTYSNASAEALIGLNPTHVIALAGSEGAPANLVKQSQAHGFKLITYPYPTNVREMISILVGNQSAVPAGSQQVGSEDSLTELLQDDRGGLLAIELMLQLGRIGEISDSASEPGRRPRVMVVFAVEPRVQAAGPETVFDDVLRQYCGAYNAAIPEIKPMSNEELSRITDPKKREAAFLASVEDPAKFVGPAPTFDREKLIEAKPDVILLMLPGEPALGTLEEDARLADFRGLDIPAVKNNRIVLINDPKCLLPSTDLPRIVAQMAKAIHPTVAQRIDGLFAAPKPVDETKPDAKDGVAPVAPPAAPDAVDPQPAPVNEPAESK